MLNSNQDWLVWIAEKLGRTFTCPLCKEQHRLPIRKVIEAPGAINRVDLLVKELGIIHKKALVLSDEVTYQVAGKTVARNLSSIMPVVSLVLRPKKEKRLSAREEYIGHILKAGKDCTLLVTVGAGTITDLGKYAGHLAEVPVISVATAASMNAYTSPVAALFRKGLKVALPVKPALAVVIDSEIIKSAPLPLTRAGFADSLARGNANADWHLGCLLTRQNYCPLPGLLVEQAEKKYFHAGRKLSNKDAATINSVMQGLTMGGFSMLLAGSSAPASGGEHLISHFWDMYGHHHRQQVFAYHGLQVGLGTFITARLYDRLRLLSPKEIRARLNTFHPDTAAELTEITSLLPNCRQAIEAQWRQKRKQISLCREVLAKKWAGLVRDIFPHVHPAAEIKKALEEAGCPTAPEDIGLSPTLTVQAIKLSRYIRNRLTILDMAAESGVLQEMLQEDFKDWL